MLTTQARVSTCERRMLTRNCGPTTSDHLPLLRSTRMRFPMRNLLRLLLLLIFWGQHGEAGIIADDDPTSPHGSTLTLGVLEPFTVGWTVGSRFASVIVPAIELIKEEQILPGYEIEWVLGDSGCRSYMGMRAAIEIWQAMEDLDAILGPACSTVCQPVGLLAAAWNIPVVSQTCTSSTLSNTAQYPTFFRVVGTQEMLAPIADAVMDVFGWRRCAIVTAVDDIWKTLAIATQDIMVRNNKTVYYYAINPTMAGGVIDSEALALVTDVVRMVKTKARVVLLYMYGDDMRNFLLQALDEGMTTGEYAFYGSENNEVILQQDHVYRPEVGTELFEGYLILNPRIFTGPAWDTMAQAVVDAFDDPRFDHINHIEDADDVHVYAGALHDAVLLWAYAVNRTLSSGQAADDGLAIKNSVLNSTLEGPFITGSVSIDHRGDRKTDQTISIVQKNGVEIPIFTWHAAAGMLEKIYHPESPDDWNGLTWGVGYTDVPSDTPPCGWMGELCVTPEPDQTLLLATGSSAGALAFLLFSVLAYRLYSARRLRHEMAEVLRCILDISEIHVSRKKLADPRFEVTSIDSGHSEAEGAAIPNGPYQGGGPSGQATRGGYSATDLLTDTRNVAGTCRGTLVAIRAYSAGGLTANSKSLLEALRHLKQITHNNLNPFLYVSLNAGRIVVITEYGTRGSLQDLIADQRVRFSWDFKISFVTDITRGLRLLHASMMGYHGHLTSANCVVDKRWVCKITDYGLENLRNRKQLLQDARDEDLLWTAPEILRGQSSCSAGGDVYALGIMVQEILTRDTPFGTNLPYLSTAEILTNVKKGESPPYRPQLDNERLSKEWIQLAHSCWHEDPTKRPEPTEILLMIVDINGGQLPSLVDAMIRNLEKHTRKLEELVKRRSLELKAEQNKMEILLSELLPRSVAEQLKLGHKVEPETYSEVTVFFSDIVGFTRVSAQSTPIQVVTMLNKLYSIFDNVLNKFDVYKVATIGDAYMVASGLPVPNGERHASEIAGMALQLLDTIKVFPIPHLENEHLYMRIGVHTGPCVAGVTGAKTPRYLLFGETIDTGSRIEAGGEAMKIHLSESTAEILQRTATFDVIYRGPMEIKGVGTIDTYWLLPK